MMTVTNKDLQGDVSHMYLAFTLNSLLEISIGQLSDGSLSLSFSIIKQQC